MNRPRAIDPEQFDADLRSFCTIAQFGEIYYNDLMDVEDDEMQALLEDASYGLDNGASISDDYDWWLAANNLIEIDDTDEQHRG